VAGSFLWAWTINAGSKKGQQVAGRQIASLPWETAQESSCLEKKIEEMKETSDNPSVIGLFRPKYLLPFYHTAAPYRDLYEGHTAGGQELSQREVKGQLSFQIPLIEGIADLPVDLVGAYTQVFYWQFYVQSAYFRETNYEPEIFVRAKCNGWGFVNLGLSHQSNGQGGKMERSWNRLYVDVQFSNSHLYVSLKPWLVILRKESIDLYNPDISKYMGSGQVVISYKKDDFIASLLLRNHLESGFRRGTEELSLSFPQMKHFRFYVQAFHGYGLSLAEYDHSTRGIGVGFAVNDWL
jgi:phospholipase A1